jgi:hypothetical protein
MDFSMDTLTGLLVGLGLAAACGFRIFVPLLIMSIASYTGYLDLRAGFAWIGTIPALVAFATATILEIGAYYIPWVDNLLDTLAAPAAVVAGVVVTVSTLTDVDPFIAWTVAVIGGGSTAGVVQLATTAIRHASTLTTGGLANPLFSTLEATVAFFLATLAVVVPVVAIGLTLVLFVYAGRKILAWRRPASARP